MNNLSNVKVNETHICVLRRVENEDRVKMDFVELKFKHYEQLRELERMANNDNRTVFDLQDYAKSTPLRELLTDFNFCKRLSDSYQWEQNIPEVTLCTYQTELDEYDKNEDEKGKQNYIREMRKSYYEKVANYVIPYMMETQYQELEEDPNVLAFSHRRVGWASPAFNLNNEFRVVYMTNFGYGMSSYFYTQIYYKGIGILPYSDWVRYRVANTSEIIRYTRRHPLGNNEWMKTMTFTADAYNAAIGDPESFIKKYIINEVEEMVSGLEDILNSTTSYRTLDSYFNLGNETVISGEDLIRFKGEKISGALSFMGQLKKLTPICNDVTSYLKRIMSCNLSIIGELEEAIQKKQIILKQILEDLDKTMPIWDNLCERYSQYQKTLDNIRKMIGKEPDLINYAQPGLDSKAERILKEKHPEYITLEDEYEKTDKKIRKLNLQKHSAESFINELQSYIDKIEAHKDYKIEETIAA